MRIVAGRGAVAELLAGSAMAGLLAGSAMAKRMAALWLRAIGKSCWQGRRSGRDAAGLGAPQKTVESGHGNKLRQGKQPAGREHHREDAAGRGAAAKSHREASKERAPAVSKERAPAAGKERAPRAASEQKRERQNPLS